MMNRALKDEAIDALKLEQRGDSFQVDDLVDSISLVQSGDRKTNATLVGKRNSGSEQSKSQDSPIVPLVQAKTLEPKRMRSGFFRRLFSSSNNDLTGMTGQESVHRSSRDAAKSSFFKHVNITRSVAPSDEQKSESTKTTPKDGIRPSQDGRSQSLSLTKEPTATADKTNKHDELKAQVSKQPEDYVLSAALEHDDQSPIRSSSLVKNDRERFPWSSTRHRSQTSEHSDSQSGDWSHVYPPYLHDPTSLSQGLENGAIDQSTLHGSASLAVEALPRSPKASSRSMNTSSDYDTRVGSPVHANRVADTSNSFDEATLLAVKASAMYESQDLSMLPEDYAAYLGIEGRNSLRETFLELFDFTDMSILHALRKLCSKLYIKGETQVIDRILESFSRRWRNCNQANKYLTQDVVHIIAYALITLNTDLYVANTQADQKMRRSAFVQNTLHAINAMLTMPEEKHRLLRVQGMNTTEQDYDTLSEAATIRYVPKSTSSNTIMQETSVHDNGNNDRPMSYPSPSQPQTAWASSDQSRGRDEYLKLQLQEMYLSIRNEQIRQPRLRMGTRHNTSETGYSTRSGQAVSPSIPSSTRSRSFVLYGDASANTSVTSVDQAGNSPVPTTGSHESSQGKAGHPLFGPYSGSRLSISSRGSRSTAGASTSTAPSRGIGFAGSLSNVIIREETNIPLKDTQDVAQAIDDAVEDDLMLSGAPFAKEGRLHYKLHCPGFSRRSKYKNWSSELFAVLERGQIRLFDFNAKVSKMNKGTFGGGDWTQSAKMVQDISLTQSVAYSQAQKSAVSDRPHMWTLRMLNGDIHYFQVGTEELIQEWISTANYWAARVTKEPLLGAVDNAEYGWSETILQPAGKRRASVAPSVTASMMGDEGLASLPGNRAIIRDWQPDPSPSLTSSLTQTAQLAAFTKFLNGLESELGRHRAMRMNMITAYSPRHPNLLKAVANFDRKTNHLQDTVKRYEVYVEALRGGIALSESIETSKQNANLDALQRVATSET